MSSLGLCQIPVWPSLLAFITFFLLSSTGELPVVPPELQEETTFDVPLEDGDAASMAGSESDTDAGDDIVEPAALAQDEDGGVQLPSTVDDDVPPAVPSTEQADAELARRLALGLLPDHWFSSKTNPGVCIWHRR
jgi:hypothetical protein